MKVVILAGGFGTRISEESHLKPKPMIGIGDKPILWHIMKIYSQFGFNDFVICLGYKGYCIKEYFANYFLHESDVTFDFRDQNRQIIHTNTAEPWRVTLVDTGKETMTGGRVKRIRPYVDGATVTATQPSGRFGALNLSGNDEVRGFQEKPRGDGSWINAGFFIMEPGVFDYIAGDETVLEQAPLEHLAKDGQLVAYKHTGFWQPMDTLRDKTLLEDLWKTGSAPWKLWK